MRIKFKKRRSLNEVYNEWVVRWSKRVEERSSRRFDEIETWRERFAWVPVRLKTTDCPEYLWLGKYYVKGEGRYCDHWAIESVNVVRGRNWERHTSKDFFKLHLKGEINPDHMQKKDYAVMTHDGTDMVIKT